MSYSGQRPPRIAELLLRRAVPQTEDGLTIVGDLHQEYRLLAGRGSRLRAQLWYWRQTFDLACHFLWRKLLPGHSRTGSPRGRPPSERPTSGRGASMLASVRRDVGYTLRGMRQRPGFTALVVLITALGVGASTAIFSVVNGVLLQPLPFHQPERVVAIQHGSSEGGFENGRFSPPDAEDFAAATETLASVATFYHVPGRMTVRLLGEGPPAILEATLVSREFFSLLGVDPVVGRTFAAEEFVAGQDRVIVISYPTWQGRFGGDPRIVGRSLTIDGEPYTVVGVMPRGFDFPTNRVEAWIPLSWMTNDKTPRHRGLRWQQMLGRLAPGASLSQAEAEAEAIVGNLAAEYPGTNEEMTLARVVPLQDHMVGPASTALLVLQATTLLVLLIGVANVGNLMLARATARGQEMAVRISLGAGRRRLVSQLLTESLVLGLVGGVAGIALALVSLDLLVALASELPRAGEIAVSLPVIAFGLAASVFAGLAFGVFPALRAARIDPQEMLKEGASAERGGKGGWSPGRPSLRVGLLVAEVALAVMLVSGAGLTLKSFGQLLNEDAGFDRSSVLAVDLRVPMDDLDSSREVPGRQLAYLAAVAQLPGVISVGGSKTALLSGGGEPYEFTRISAGDEPFEFQADAGTFIVTPGYFETLQIPLLVGRTFDERDTMAVVLNESMALALWPDTDAVGQSLYLGQNNRFEVIGVVADVRNEGIASRARTAIYVPNITFARTSMTLYLRTEGDPLALAGSVRDAIWSVHSQQPVANVRTLQQAVLTDLSQPRLLTILLGLFAGLALTLAALGVYGVVSYGVSQRTSEMGIRLALGAKGTDLVRMVVRQSMVVCGVGVVLGVAGSLALGRLLASVLYGVSPSDPATLSTVVLFLVAVSVLASWLPAIRASRMDPSSALRSE